eukprot:CAMPEP_0177762764 /NCGR_PEP_ID=MMETSP0491_2-20121128/6517_1 /TAXON_ID=63592 /ORGANISM="Tetraselmis chuii, Strain PLY429" /LENGTH=241 /DNA_ID=CAMNT_0019278837 /DNA_START=306 /DNA_END=1031 /DNA_ORIENTATION=+
MVIVPVLIFAGLLGLLAFLSSLGGNPSDKPAVLKKSGAKKGSKKSQKTKLKAVSRRSGPPNPEVDSVRLPSSETRYEERQENEIAEGSGAVPEQRVASSSDDDEEEGGVNDFLGIDDVLPTNRGVYVVEGSRDETAQDDSLWDGWETVDPVKYNIPRGHKLTAQGVPSPAAQPRPRTASAGNSKAQGKTKNEKRREKEKLVRSLQQSRPVGSSVAQRIGSAGTKRHQQDPTTRNTAHVPGM